MLVKGIGWMLYEQGNWKRVRGGIFGRIGLFGVCKRWMFGCVEDL